MARRNERQTAPNPMLLSCINCGEDKPCRHGLICTATDATNRHFHCDSCLTSWVSVLNDQATENPEQLNARKAQVKCTSPECDSNPFSHTQLCQHIKDSRVLSKYLENIRTFDSKKLFEDYQVQISGILQAFKTAASECAGMESKIESIIKKIEIESLERTLRIQMPDARACKECGFGPVVQFACSDIRMHHGQVMGTGLAAVNNSCPQCGWRGQDWDEWKHWNGKLPARITGGIESGLDPIPDPSVVQTSSQPRRTCIFFLSGLCRYGQRCRFWHPDPVLTNDPVPTNVEAALPQPLGEGFDGSLATAGAEAIVPANNLPRIIAESQANSRDGDRPVIRHMHVADGRGRGHGHGRGHDGIHGRGRGRGSGRGRGQIRSTIRPPTETSSLVLFGEIVF